jgi:hypothetical protein
MLSVVVLAGSLAVGNGGPGTGAAAAPVTPSFDGAWKGTLEYTALTWDVEIREGKMTGKRGGDTVRGVPCTLTFDGEGAVRLRYGGKLYLGIYTWEGRRLVLCFGRSGAPRPARFAARAEAMLWTLEPVK